MVRAKLQYYYTFKIVSGEGEPLKVEAHKWEEETGDHSGDTYIVRPDGASFISCSCPAFKECKHLRCVKEAIQDGKAQEFWNWRWDEKNGWKKVDDIPSIEEIDL